MTWIVKQGDCLQSLKKLESESVDLICTDPPYGISFMGRDWDKALPDIEIFKECHRVLKSGAFAFVMSGARADCLWRMIAMLEQAGFWIHFTPIFWCYATGFPKAQNIAKFIEKKHRPPDSIKDVEGLGGLTSDKGYNVTKHHEIYDKFTHPDAIRLQGSFGGFQPKPAAEVVIVAMKPMSEKTFIEQVLKNGKGVTWLDSVRIPTEDEWHRNEGQTPCHEGHNGMFRNKSEASIHKQGRFPANLLVQDDVLNDGRETSSPETYKRNADGFNQSCYGQGMGESAGAESLNYGDTGSFSRYFDLDAWFAKRFEFMPEQVRRTLPFMIVPKPSVSEKNKGCEKLPDYDMKRGIDTEGRTPNDLMDRFKTVQRKNPHPTVKPIQLMSYLIELGSRKGDMIVDPFAGSGTTGIAAVLLERNVICLELSEENCQVAKARISAWSKYIQKTLF